MIQELLGEKQHRLVKNPDTRWLAIERSVVIIREHLSSLIVTLTLESHGSGLGADTAQGLASTLSSTVYLQMLLLWSDLMPELTKLSAVLQTSNLDFVKCEIELKKLVSFVQVLIDRQGILLLFDAISCFCQVSGSRSLTKSRTWFLSESVVRQFPSRRPTTLLQQGRGPGPPMLCMSFGTLSSLILHLVAL